MIRLVRPQLPSPLLALRLSLATSSTPDY